MTHPPTFAPTVTNRLRHTFAAEDMILSAALKKARASFTHPGVKGDVVEVAVRSFLSSHLPRKFGVGTGEVIDRYGSRSSQLDVIVLNDEQPFVHDINTNGMYFAEGVSAVGEVKSSMGSRELLDILEKGEKLRTLRPTPLAGDQIQSSPGDISRFVASFPYFGLAIESSMTVSRILDTLNAASDVASPDGSGVMIPKLDALFVLNRKVFTNFGHGTGSHKFMYADGTSATGWIAFEENGALVNLFAWLNAVIPRITRANSIAVPYLIATSPPYTATTQ